MSKKWNYIFFALLVGISLLYGYQDIFFMRPYSMHQWRQCDCLSIAYNYYKEGMHFFSPAVHWSGPTGDGKTCTSECPLLYYLVACLWTVFGYHEFIYRMLDTFIAFSGLYYLFKIAKEILGDGLWAIITSLFLFSSTIYAYYANNFTTDVPALALVIIGWYHFLRFYKEGKQSSFIKYALFCLLAALTKITALLSFIPLFLIIPIEMFSTFKFKNDGKLFQQPFKQILPVILIIGITGAWTLFAIKYNKAHIEGLFSTQTYPISEIGKHEIKEILMIIYNNQLPVFLNTPVFIFILVLFGALLVNYKQTNRLLLFITTFIFIGSVAYLLLWFQIFNVHDYYLIHLLIFIPFVLITFLLYLKNTQPAIFTSVKIKITACVILAFSIYNCAVNMHMRYNPLNPIARYSFTNDRETTSFWNWYYWDYQAHYKALETITPYLRSLGLKRTDKVVSFPDISINVTLYLMDQKGFTGFGYQKKGDDYVDLLDNSIREGINYFVLNDPSLADSAYLQPYIKNKIGEYKNVNIYSLKGIDVNTLAGEVRKKKILDSISERIRANPDWYNQIKKGAKERNISTDSAVKLNAIWMLQNQKK